MIYLTLFLEFLKIGAFSFGGAYGAIPLIQETVLSRGWLDEEMFTNIIAVSESTPGPIMVNTATYIGSVQGGVPGAAAATLGVILPSFVIILIVSFFLQKFLANRYAQSVMSGVKPCIAGVILATGGFMALQTVIGAVAAPSLDIKAIIILAVIAAAIVLYKKILKKELSPIILIVISAVLGAVVYGFFNN